MDNKKLRQLRWLPGEIEQISTRLAELPDTPENKARRESMLLRLEQCQKECAEGIAYLEAAPDSYIRQILRLRYIDGLTYRQIAARIRGATPESIRQQCLRYVKKYPEPPQQMRD